MGESILRLTAMRFAPLTLATLVMASRLRIDTPIYAYATLFVFELSSLWGGIRKWILRNPPESISRC
jgi:hypothetical protein